MLELKFVRENPQIIRADLHKRNDREKLDILENVLNFDIQLKKIQADLDELRHSRNVVSKRVSQLIKDKASAQDIEKSKAEAAIIPTKIEKFELEYKMVQKALEQNLMKLPNVLDSSVPTGKDSTENKIIKTFKEPTSPIANMPTHAEIAESIGGADFAGSAKISGAGFTFLTGGLARLELALELFALDYLAAKGFTIVNPPIMMNREVYQGVTDLQDFEQVMYKIEGMDAFLIATSEHPMAAWHSNSVFDEFSLPVKLAGISPCFRKEIGAHGVDTKGLFRLHQFNKIEQFVYCKPSESWQYFEQLMDNAEQIWRMLDIPYQVVSICTGDIGTVAAKKLDIEAWFPREQAYKEVVSCSNCTNYQSVGLNIKYRIGKQGAIDEQKEFVHTLNSTAVATTRTLRAIIENYYQADGSVTIPKVLVPYMNGIESLKPINRK